MNNYSYIVTTIAFVGMLVKRIERELEWSNSDRTKQSGSFSRLSVDARPGSGRLPGRRRSPIGRRPTFSRVGAERHSPYRTFLLTLKDKWRILYAYRFALPDTDSVARFFVHLVAPGKGQAANNGFPIQA